MHHLTSSDSRPVVVLATAALALSAMTPSVTVASQPSTSRESEQQLAIRLQYDPHDADARSQLVTLLQKKSAYRAAAKVDVQWLKDNAGEYSVLNDLVAMAITVLNDPELAVEQQRAFLARARRSDDEVSYDQVVSSLANNLNATRRSSEALALLEKLVHQTPDDAGLWAQRATPLVAAGRLREAIASLRRAISIDPSDENAHMELGDLLFRSGQLSDSESEYRAAISTYDSKYKQGNTSGVLPVFVPGRMRVG